MKHSFVYIICLVALSQLTCRHGQPATTERDEVRSIADCMEFVADRPSLSGHFTLRGSALVTFHPRSVRQSFDKDGAVLEVEAFNDFLNIYGPSALPLIDEDILEDFAEYTHVTRVLDALGVATTDSEIDLAIGQIRSRFPDDDSFEHFLG